MQHVSYEIDYGKSEKYSKEDMDEAITQIIEAFDSWEGCFHSPREGGDAWNPDFEYEDWQWILARTSDSGWELLQWGY